MEEELTEGPGSQRKYRILNVLGVGGFGKVYRARLEGRDGFYKDVAIKLLKPGGAPDEILRRFRDEARILGLIRDRAIVSVDPPTRLAGRWAVVMEFVDGASAARLLKQVGAFPPKVALEVVEEIARVLHKLYDHPGMDGTPLRLLHRDIKPANIQITPFGEVKVLDFGIARADFEHRETYTTLSIGGTLGYIAPERLNGVEGPSGDIYSLGVVLYQLVTCKKPPKRPSNYAPGDQDGLPEDVPAEELVLRLSDRMRAYEREHRPTAAEVEKICRKLRQQIEGDTLRDWAESMVTSLSTISEDDLVGTMLSETENSIHDITKEVTRGSSPMPDPPTAEADFNENTGFSSQINIDNTRIGILAAGSSLAIVLAIGAAIFAVSVLQPAPAPVVELGPDTDAEMGERVQLSAAASAPEGYTIADYEWSFISRPSSSTVEVSTEGSTAAFAPDVAGDYVLQLRVQSDAGRWSTADTKTVRVAQTPPDAPKAAIEKPSEPLKVGQDALFSAEASQDPSGFAISTYEWTLETRPESSSAEVQPDGALARLRADEAGNYTVALRVQNSRDVWSPKVRAQVSFEATADVPRPDKTHTRPPAPAEPETTTETAPVEPPTVDAGADKSAKTGQKLSLSATIGTPDGVTPTVAWTIEEQPSGASANLTNASSATPSFETSKAGHYVLAVKVTTDAGTTEDRIAIDIAAAGPKCTVTITSSPLGATVRMDGRQLCTTPCIDQKIPAGAHDFEMEMSGKQMAKHETIACRGADYFMWEQGAPDWVAQRKTR